MADNLPLPSALLVFDDFVRGLADGRGAPFLIRRAGGPVRRATDQNRFDPPVTVGWLSRREAENALAEWAANLVEGGR